MLTKKQLMSATFVAVFALAGALWWHPLWIAAGFESGYLLADLYRRRWPPQHAGGLRDYARDVFNVEERERDKTW